MSDRTAKVRVIDGKASECPVGGLLAHRWLNGDLGTVWERIEDSDDDPGESRFRRVEDGEVWIGLPLGLNSPSYVRVELVPVHGGLDKPLPKEWRVVEGEAREVPMGEHICYRWAAGDLSEIKLKRIPPADDTPPGHLCLVAVHDANLTWELLPEDLGRYVRVSLSQSQSPCAGPVEATTAEEPAS